MKHLFCLVLTLFLCSSLSRLAPGQTTNASLPLRDKTLVVWVSPANLSQRGGSALTIEKSGGAFDAIVLGELAKAKWMAGSENFRRTKREQETFPAETATAAELVQVALVYQDK